MSINEYLKENESINENEESEMELLNLKNNTATSELTKKESDNSEIRNKYDQSKSISFSEIKSTPISNSAIKIPNLLPFPGKKTQDDNSIAKTNLNSPVIPNIPMRKQMNQSVLIPSLPGMNISTPRAPTFKNRIEDKKSKYGLKPSKKYDGEKSIFKKFGVKGNNKINDVWKIYLDKSILDKND